MEYPKFAQEFNTPGIELLPHREPFLFVDRLLSADDTGALGEYTYTLEKNDFFRGHFPDFPIVPGVILIESMAQVAGAAIVARGQLEKDKASFILARVNDVKFLHPVRPGDRLVTVVKNIRIRKPLASIELKGYVGDELACECSAKCTMTEK